MNFAAQAPRATPGAGDRPATAGGWLRPLRDWPRMLRRALGHEPAMVRVVLAAVRGSAPRETGVGMIVGRDSVAGTIGGGQLEWQAIALARTMLRETVPARLERLVLATDAGQCCGGVVELWFERYTRADVRLLRAAEACARRGPSLLRSTLTGTGLVRDILEGRAAGVPSGLVRSDAGGVALLQRLDDALPPLWLYGAGHVGQAIVRIAADLPLRLTWIDSRPELFPADTPESVHIVCSTDPAATVASAPRGARFVILTHSHALDYSLCRAVLERGDFAWAGLIGSGSKAARFRSRLARDGVDPGAIGRLACPIGVAGITSKWPAAIAVAVAAQLLQDLGAAAPIEALPPADSTSGVPTCTAADCARCGPARERTGPRAG